jgi:hypothetical protein
MCVKVMIFRFSLTVALIFELGNITSAQAASRRFSHQINGESSFEAMVQTAESIAQATANQAFADPNTTEIMVNIAGEQEGQIAPVLLLNVTSEQWQRQPSIQVWASYPGGVKRLLGFDRPILSPTTTIVTASNPIRDRLTDREANFFK